MDEKPRYRLRPWKVAAFLLAGVLVAGGTVLALGKSAPKSPTPASATSTARPPGSSSLFPTSELPTPRLPAPDAAVETAPEDPWSPALLRGGLSFFVAFAFAFAFRTFLRIAIFFVGLWAASLFLLHQAGWVEIHWSMIDASFTDFAGAVSRQFSSVTSFITGSLPSAGMAGLGLFTGFRKG